MTILYLNDYRRFPNAIVDYETKNESFLKLARLYRKMGVKNAVFHLTLLQPALQGVDPHSPDLTVAQKLMIIDECKYNIWYYFREVCRVPPAAGSHPVQFRANRGNIALIWLFLSHMDSALIQPRQTGKSVSTDCLMIWLIYIGCNNTLINLITKDNDLRKKNIERLKSIRDYLPKYLIPVQKDDPNNQIEITCGKLNNTYSTGVAQNTESGANNLGRGCTSAINHIDEGPFCTHIGTTIPALLSSGNAAVDEARANNAPYGNIFTTTAGKKDDRDGRYMYEMITGGANWNERYLDLRDHKELFTVVKQACTGRKVLVNCTFSHRQLGYTDEWLHEKMNASNSYGEVADRDYLNIWTAGTQRSPLSTKINNIILESQREVLYTEITREGYTIRWYIEEEELQAIMATGKFIMGMDTSDAISRDAITGVILSVEDLSVVGAFGANETNLISFSSFVANLMVRYENIILIPERKSSAQTFIDTLLLRLPALGIDPFRRIFNKSVDEASTNPEAFREINIDMSKRNERFYDERKAKFGFVTTGPSRELLYSTVLQNAAKKAGHLIRDKTLSAEIRGLVEKNGRIDHNSSGHDDFVIAWLLTHWMLSHGKNLEHYGIDPSRIDTVKMLGDDSNTVDYDTMIRDLEQKHLRDQLNVLIEKLESSTSDYEAYKVEQQISFIRSGIRQDTDEAFSLDALIKKVNENRNQERTSAIRRSENFDGSKVWQQMQRRTDSGYSDYRW